MSPPLQPTGPAPAQSSRAAWSLALSRARRSRRRFDIGLLLLSVVLIVGATLYSFSTIAQLRSSVQWVTHTLQVQSQLEELLAKYSDVEMFLMAFRLSGEPAHRELHENAKAVFYRQLDSVSTSVSDDPEQLQRLSALRESFASRQVHYQVSADERAQLGVEAAAERARMRTGAPGFYQIRDIIRDMTRAEQTALSARQTELDGIMVQSTATVLLVNVLALVIGVIALLSLRRGHRAESEQRLAQVRAEEAERANREKSQFLASMSHEIRTPMNAVFGFTQLLEKLEVGAKGREYIRAIQTSGRALLALINDILDLSRIEAGKLALSPQPTDIRELFDSTLGVFAEAASNKGLRLRIRISPGLPRCLELDPDRLRQILNNLLSNAIKYTDEGEVRLNAEARSREDGLCSLVIEVRDTGSGISHAQQAQLFQPFYRAVDEAEAPVGTGLGLSIVRRLLDLMGGRIELESAPGKGSLFRVVLEKVPVPSHAPADESSSAPVRDFGRLRRSRLLVVDDVAWNRELLAAFLAEGDHELEFAANGRQAVDIAAAFKPDVVLMDLRMPVMDGREATRLLRAAAGRQAPAVLAVSASGMASEEQALNVEFDGYLRKPITREMLFDALSEHLPLKSASAPSTDVSAGAPGSVQPEKVPHAASSGIDPLQRAAAAERLRVIEAEELAAISGALRVAELRRLAAELQRLGERGGFAGIRHFGERLDSAIERFDVLQMEALLNQLPEYIQSAIAEEAT
jgi:signal transduction histidine kinase/DNA-binding response OmpR family regulator